MAITVLLGPSRDQALDDETSDSNEVRYELNTIRTSGYSSNISYDGNDTFAMSPKQTQEPHVKYF